MGPELIWPEDLEDIGLFWGRALARLKAVIEGATPGQRQPYPESEGACGASKFCDGDEWKSLMNCRSRPRPFV